MQKDEFYIQRCFDLARLGMGKVAPNPMVGAVLVYQNTIIGEGYHQQYGGAHAEVNAFNNVPEGKKRLIQKATLYVSLEPCSITGNTPPCTSLIIQHKVKNVVISSEDYTPGVYQKSKQILVSNKINIKSGVLLEKGEKLGGVRKKIINTNHPYVILKYAQTQDYFMGTKIQKQFWISNHFTKRMVHKWRSEVDAILVGKQTALIDNPSLTTRYYFGDSPIRVLIDKNLEVPNTHQLFDSNAPSIVFNQQKSKIEGHIEWIKIDFSLSILPQLLTILHQKEIASLLVEGGAHTIQAFINENLWDEARITTGNKHLCEGISAPLISQKITHSFSINDDEVKIYFNE